MRLDLNAAPQSFFEHWLQIFRLLGQIAGSVRPVAVRFQQRCATRTERAVEDNFDRALCVVMVERVDYRSFAQKTLRVVARAVNAIHKTQFHFAGFEHLVEKIDVVVMAAGVLDFAPAEFDFAIDSSQERLLALGVGRFRNIFLDQIHRVIEQHAVRFAVAL